MKFFFVNYVLRQISIRLIILDIGFTKLYKIYFIGISDYYYYYRFTETIEKLLVRIFLGINHKYCKLNEVFT